MNLCSSKVPVGIVIGAIALGAASVANAATLTMKFNNVGPSKSLQVNYNSGRSFNQDNAGGWTTYTTGRMNWTDQYNRSVSTFCTQLVEYINYGQTVTYTMTSVEGVPDPNPGAMGPERAKLVRDLYAKHFATVKASADANLNAAFQLAIWEITHENLSAADADGMLAQLDVFSGALAANEANGVTSTVGTLAMSMLDSLGEDGFESLGGGLIGLTHALYQDQLIVVPLPVPMALAGLGLLGAVALRRRVR